MLRLFILVGIIALQGCAVSEEAIKNKELYCSGVYKGIRAVGRVATEVTTGVSVPDICNTIDTITEESTEGKS